MAIESWPLKSCQIMPANNLPIQVTSFIGREGELVDLQRLLTATLGAGTLAHRKLAVNSRSAATQYSLEHNLV